MAAIMSTIFNVLGLGSWASKSVEIKNQEFEAKQFQLLVPGSASTTDKYALAVVLPKLFVAIHMYHPSSS